MGEEIQRSCEWCLKLCWGQDLAYWFSNTAEPCTKGRDLLASPWSKILLQLALKNLAASSQASTSLSDGSLQEHNPCWFYREGCYPHFTTDLLFFNQLLMLDFFFFFFKMGLFALCKWGHSLVVGQWWGCPVPAPAVLQPPLLATCNAFLNICQNFEGRS